MSHPIWRLQGHIARLQLNDLVATVDVACPQRGIFDLTAHGIALPHWRLLEAHTLGEGSAPGVCEDVVDCYVRGDDVVATYRETQARHLRPEVYWRRICLDAPCAAVGFELILSMQTSLLDSDPGLLCRSAVSADRVEQLVDAGQDRFELRIARPDPLDVGPQSGKGVFLFRMSDAPWSYVQMTLPADFYQAELVGPSGDPACLSQRLFSERLEKGVIRRVRVRGMFLPQDNDAAMAAAAYQQWMGEEPPLTV